MRKDIHGLNHVMLEETNRQSHIRRGSKEIKMQILSYISCESSFGLSRTEQNLKWDIICLWEGAHVSPHCARQIIFSLQLQDPALFSFKQTERRVVEEGTQPLTPVTVTVQSKWSYKSFSKPWHPKKSQGNVVDKQPSAGKSNENTSTNA